MSKVCFYLASLAKGGAQRVIINLTEYLLKNGYEVTIVTTKQEAEEYALPGGAKRVFSDITGNEVTESRIRNFYRRFMKLRNVWKQEKPDIVISFIGLNNMMAIATNFFRKTPVLISVRANPTMEYYTKLLRLISKTLFIKADGIILQTMQQKEYFPKPIQRKCIILPNPLNPEFVKNEESTNKEKQIIAVGRVDENKNHKMLVEAFSRIAKDYPEWSLVILGNGEEKQRLDRQIEQSGLQDRIQAPGNVSDVAKRLEQARIYVMTSSEEGMPNSLIEAMAKGLACISTDCPCGGPAELIRTGENGILIPVKDTDALEAALREILSNEVYERKLSENAVEIKEKLAPEPVCGEWKTYLESFLA